MEKKKEESYFEAILDNVIRVPRPSFAVYAKEDGAFDLDETSKIPAFRKSCSGIASNSGMRKDGAPTSLYNFGSTIPVCD